MVDKGRQGRSSRNRSGLVSQLQDTITSQSLTAGFCSLVPSAAAVRSYSLPKFSMPSPQIFIIPLLDCERDELSEIINKSLTPKTSPIRFSCLWCDHINHSRRMFHRK